MSSKSVDKLMALKEEIESARREANEAEGALKQSLKQLKDDFGLSNVGEAQARLEELDSEIKRLENDIDERVAELEEFYEW